jgi:hypothetical protein
VYIGYLLIDIISQQFPLRQSVSKPRSGLKRIMADVWLDRTGYVPGEKIQFNANIDNYSGKSVRGTTVQLIQVQRILLSNRVKFNSVFKNSTRRLPMANTRAESRQFCGREKVEKFVIRKFKFGIEWPSSFRLFRLPECHFAASSTSPTSSRFITHFKNSN